MIIHGSSPSQTFIRDAGSAGRFWYWRGASGRRYIHSVYPAGDCPPLPGAVFVAVKRTGALRTALAAGLMPALWQSPDAGMADEVHVHLLARDPAQARVIADDLSEALLLEGEAFTPQEARVAA